MSNLGIYWGLTPDDWRTVSIVAQGFIALFLVMIGIVQIMAFVRNAREIKKTRSLEACTRFISDPIINTARRSLFEAQRSGELEKDPYKFRPDIVNMLNYFEYLARGIEGGVYDEVMVHDHLSRVLRTYVKKFLAGDTPQKLALPISVLANQVTIDLCAKWDKLPGEPPIPYHDTLLSAQPQAEEGRSNVYPLKVAD